MNDIIYPRSPRETMAGWIYLPRYIDKIRLHLAGRLHPDYQPNFGKGFDGLWLNAAGLTHERMIEVVRNTITDGEVCDWVRQNVEACGFHRSFNSAINNARSDKLGSGIWAEALLHERRCVIPVSAFHEWGPSAGGRKQAHEFSDPDDDWLWIAGLWEPGGDHMRWKLPDPDAMTA